MYECRRLCEVQAPALAVVVSKTVASICPRELHVHHAVEEMLERDTRPVNQFPDLSTNPGSKGKLKISVQLNPFRMR